MSYIVDGCRYYTDDEIRRMLHAAMLVGWNIDHGGFRQLTIEQLAELVRSVVVGATGEA